MGDYVAVIVELNHAAHELGGRHISGEHEHAECAVVGGLPSFGLARGAVKNGRLAQTALARGDALELHVVAHVDLRIVLGFGGNGGVAGEVGLAHEHGDLGRVLGEEHGFLGGRESSADHEHLLAGEELTVAGGAVGHTAAGVLRLALESKLTR